MPHPSYTGYYFDVRIFDPENAEQQVFHFQAPDFPFITAVTVNFQQTWDVATISFTVDAPFQVGLAMLNSNMFRAGNQIEVVIGYPDGPKSHPFYGFLHQGGVGLELTPNGLTGTVTCHSYSKVETYEHALRTNNLKEAFEGAAIGSGRYKTVRYEGGADAAFAEFSNYKMTGFKVYSDVIELAHRLTNTWSVPDADELLAGKVETLVVNYGPDQKSGKPTRKFVMRGQFSEEGGVFTYPIDSFGPQMDSGWFVISPGSASGVQAPRVNDAGEVVTTEAKPEDSEEKAGQDEVAADAVEDRQVPAGEGGQEKQYNKQPGDKEATATFVVPGAAEEWQEVMLKNLQTHMARRDGWKANIVTVGIPDIRAQEVCEVLGMGTLYNGIWTIDGVTHQCALGNFTTTLQVHSGLSKNLLGPNTETAS